MKVELKNIQINKAKSETSNAYSAELFVDDVRAGVATNDGQGGVTFISPFDEASINIIRAAQKYCETLPPLVIGDGDDKDSLPMTLELYLDELVDKFAFNQQMQKDMKKGIIMGIEGERYQLCELSPSPEALLNNPKGRALLAKFMVDFVKPALKEGQRVLNTNLPEEFLALVNPPADMTNQPASKASYARSPHKRKPLPGKNGLA
ncbi:hypothetical protein [Chitinophaga tropicalis]|uniref:Uncharacterized protein n=1 Tax=Chitinophaga tropicalis TaxID=2683588 RepID=A0A7K1U050_9BACT|nr:hypothetical protein [Chitinophaga tropicalis]MVT07738.1 hypothetical protein [Chitinophaga tropicalis]